VLGPHAHCTPCLPNTSCLVFAFRTLHHFENHVLVLAECERVLARGGHFLFIEEPMDSALRRCPGRRAGIVLRWTNGAVTMLLDATVARQSDGAKNSVRGDHETQ